MGSFEKLRKNILPYWDKKHDQQWEKDPGDRYPGYAKAEKQVNCLEYGEHGNCFEGHGLNVGGMVFLQQSSKVGKKKRVIIIFNLLKWNANAKCACKHAQILCKRTTEISYQLAIHKS